MINIPAGDLDFLASDSQVAKGGRHRGVVQWDCEIWWETYVSTSTSVSWRCMLQNNERKPASRKTLLDEKALRCR